MGNEQGGSKKKQKGHQQQHGGAELAAGELRGHGPAQSRQQQSAHGRTRQSIGHLHTTLMESTSGMSIDDFQLLKVVGRGSYGKVMQVRYNRDNQVYAMKVIRKDMVFKRRQEEHTRTERRILEQIDHPFIVSLRFAFQSSEKLYMVLDYFNGGELFFHLKQSRGFDVQRARYYAAEVISAMEHLHELNVIYRDLKPENVLLDEEGHVRVTDFGLSKEGIELPNGTKTFCGTPEYLAPEVLRGQAYGKPIDIWSLGNFIYEMTVGRPPFYTRNRQEMYQRILNENPRFPANFEGPCREVIMFLLDKNPLTRPTIQQVKEHPFFSSFDWNALINKTIPPPFVPEIGGGAADASNFDQMFTNLQVEDTPVQGVNLPQSKIDAFEGFTYLPQENPLEREEHYESFQEGGFEPIAVNRPV